MVFLILRPKIGKRTDEALSLWRGSGNTSFASDLFVTCLLQTVLVVAGPPFVVATAAVAAVARGAPYRSQVDMSWGSLQYFVARDDANDVGCCEFWPCISCQHNRRGTFGRAAVLLRGQGHARLSLAGEHKQRSLPSCSVSGLLRDQARWWSQGCQRLSRLEDDPCGRRSIRLWSIRLRATVKGANKRFSTP